MRRWIIPIAIILVSALGGFLASRTLGLVADAAVCWSLGGSPVNGTCVAP